MFPLVRPATRHPPIRFPPRPPVPARSPLTRRIGCPRSVTSHHATASTNPPDASNSRVRSTGGLELRGRGKRTGQATRLVHQRRSGPALPHVALEPPCPPTNHTRPRIDTVGVYQHRPSQGGTEWSLGFGYPPHGTRLASPDSRGVDTPASQGSSVRSLLRRIGRFPLLFKNGVGLCRDEFLASAADGGQTQWLEWKDHHNLVQALHPDGERHPVNRIPTRTGSQV